MNSGKNIPGYSGFVPYKSEYFGNTTCSANRAAEIAYKNQVSFKHGNAALHGQKSTHLLNRSTSVDSRAEAPQLQMILGNKSKDSKTWINGPTHEVRNQCLPGYGGFIPGVKAENLIQHTYANNTATSFTNAIPRGYEGAGPYERFKSVQQMTFVPESNRRIIENPNQHASRRDYLEYSIAINNNLVDKRDQFLDKSLSPIKQAVMATTFSPTQFKRDLNGSLYSQVRDLQVRPRILQSKIGESPKFLTLSEGFKQVFTQTDREDEAGLKLPVVGYTGHRKGLVGENYYSKNFRDTVMLAESNLRKQRNQLKFN